MHTLLYDEFGGPEVLRYEEAATPEVLPGHALLRMRAVGLNFADIYRRRGNYTLEGNPPYVLGYEGAGEVVAVGAGVEDIEVGDRIGFADVPRANSTHVNVPVEHAIPLPDGIDDVTAAGVLLQGLTAQYLARDSYPIGASDKVLIHAAAGGVGQFLTQFAKAAGAEVFAVASSVEKRELARRLGADHVLDATGDWVREALDIVPGGMTVTYDSVGSTLAGSLAVTAVRGTVVIFGMAGGNPEPVDPRMLMGMSVSLRGADLWHYLDSREARRRRASDLFAGLLSGRVAAPKIETYALSDGAKAHARLESRQLIGKIVMIPND